MRSQIALKYGLEFGGEMLICKDIINVQLNGT